MSMTGFGRASVDVDGTALRLELRSVNNRFLDIKVHLPWQDGEAEQRIRSLIRGQLQRGRIDVSVNVEDEGTNELQVNVALARRLGLALSELASLLNCDRSTAAALLPPQQSLLTGAQRGAAAARLAGALDGAVDRALTELIEMRRREGEALRSDLAANLQAVASLAARIEELTRAAPQQREQKLRERLARLQGDVDADRLAQELALLADRCDISEELARLDSHRQQLSEMLQQGGAVGRKIEFMLQEVNRELNTIASKSNDAEVARQVVEAKGYLEKLREQAQNVE